MVVIVTKTLALSGTVSLTHAILLPLLPQTLSSLGFRRVNPACSREVPSFRTPSCPDPQSHHQEKAPTAKLLRHETAEPLRHERPERVNREKTACAAALLIPELPLRVSTAFICRSSSASGQLHSLFIPLLLQQGALGRLFSANH